MRLRFPKKNQNPQKHSEATLITEVYARMLTWYSSIAWPQTNPTVVYLYTFYSPCATHCQRRKSCTTIIESFINELETSRIQLYVGYSVLWKDKPKDGESFDEENSQDRLNLIHVYNEIKRRTKRHPNDTDECSTEDLCSLQEDFNNGGGQMQWARGGVITTLILVVLALTSARRVLWYSIFAGTPGLSM